LLRVLLNYETNEHKLLQLVLLGQTELHEKIVNIPNFFDRISLKYTLNPFSLKETEEMIEFRIRKAGYKSRMHLFLKEAVIEIHQATQGYPRRITMLCHKALKELVMRNKSVVSAGVIEDIIQNEMRAGWHRKDPLLLKNSY
jgi:general secretion pathway protein A